MKLTELLCVSNNLDTVINHVSICLSPLLISVSSGLEALHYFRLIMCRGYSLCFLTPPCGDQNWGMSAAVYWFSSQLCCDFIPIIFDLLHFHLYRSCLTAFRYQQKGVSHLILALHESTYEGLFARLITGSISIVNKYESTTCWTHQWSERSFKCCKQMSHENTKNRNKSSFLDLLSRTLKAVLLHRAKEKLNPLVIYGSLLFLFYPLHFPLHAGSSFLMIFLPPSRSAASPSLNPFSAGSSSMQSVHLLRGLSPPPFAFHPPTMVHSL